MFFGTTPSVVSQFLQKEIKRSKPNNTFVPFAGNFVVEQLSAIVYPDADIHSTDVSLYSRMLGFALSNQKSDITFKDHIKEDFPVFENDDDPMVVGAGALFFSEVGKCYRKTDVAYYRNMMKDAKNNQEKYFDQIVEKITKFKNALSDSHFYFYGRDACEIIPNAEKGDLMFYDPPVLQGDYEKMFTDLEACCNFEPEPYTEMNEEIKRDHLKELRDKGVQTIYRTNNPLHNIPDGYKEIFRYQYKYHGFYCLYSNVKEGSFVGRWTPLKDKMPNYQIIGEKDVIRPDSKIDVIPCKGDIANHYRLLWVKKAEMSSAGYSYLMFIDEKLIGLVTLSDGMNFGTDLCTIFSDPAAPTSNYERLSKLILYLCCTEEMLKMFNDQTLWEHVGFTTRVFTNYPVSMKYRKQFELEERVEEKEGNWKYKLIYQNRDKILPTFRDGLIAWLDSKDGSLVYDESHVPDHLLEWN